MALSKWANAVFRQRKTSLSLLLWVTYGVIAVLYLYDHIHYKHVETDGYQDGLLQQSWLDLQNITYGYHPYGSRDNDRVHDYILDQVTNCTQNVTFAQVSDDYEQGRSSLFVQEDVFNASSQVSRVVYFESSNIVVKIDGLDKDLPGLLLSAHFDSVPTSHGATDDGKGIASMLAILRHYSQNQPRRTMVFNFNNNEEFGLMGATAFMDHEWSKLVKYVINLEGTGTGTKAVLFRTSDASTANMYKKAVTQLPFGNSIYQQGFYEGYIHSETDYRVYSSHGLRGWDIAFYKPRDLYHTKKDSIRHTSREALWNMLHTAWLLTEYVVANDDDIDSHNFSPAIYFDVSGLTFFSCSASQLFKVNCLALVALPMVMVILYLTRPKSKSSTWFKSIFSFLMSSIVIIFTERGIINSTNPFVLSRDYIRPLLLLTTEFVLSNYLILRFWNLEDDFKTIVLGQLSILFWIITLIATVLMKKKNYMMTGIYPITIAYILLSLGTIIGQFFLDTRDNQESSHNGEIETEAEIVSVPTDMTVHSDANYSTIEPSQEVDERAPLLPRGKQIPTDTKYSWSLQFLVVVPICTYVLFNSFDQILDATHQTVQESIEAQTRLSAISVLGAIFIGLPLIPFVNQINFITILVFVMFSISCLSTVIFEHPFTENSPLKIRFVQTIDHTGQNLVNLYGLNHKRALHDMLADLPSVKRSQAQVECIPSYDGMDLCQYVGLQPHLFDGQGLSVDVVRNDRWSDKRLVYKAELEIKVLDNRVCTVFFNQSDIDGSRVRKVVYYKQDNSTSNLEMDDGIDEWQLHKLDFEQQVFHIGVEWLPGRSDDALGVSVSCHWAEYDSQVLIDGELFRRVPAYDELLEYSTVDYTVTNKDKGIVIMKDYIEL